MSRVYFSSEEIKKLQDLPEEIKGYLTYRFSLDLEKWIEWGEEYEWNHDAMILSINDVEDKPD